MTYQNYSWTAFTEADLLKSGDNNLSYGDSFTMGQATVNMSTSDNDGSMSGGCTYWDWGTWTYKTKSADGYGQGAVINGQSTGCRMYAEQYHVLCGSDGKTYYLLEINVEGHDAPGAGDSYFTFYGAVPPAGVTLTVTNTCAVSGDWVDYSCLGGGDVAPATGEICGRLSYDADQNDTELHSNGFYNVYDQGISGKTVNLVDADGNVVASTTTDANGCYSFEVEVGQYRVQFPQIDGYGFADQNVGNDCYDSDANAEGLTGLINVTADCKVSNVDASIQCDPNDAPTFTNVPSNGEYCVDENSTVVADLDATDADHDTLTYSIVGGTDAGSFEINAQTGELSFKSAPDYEAPGSSDGDNSYQVVVQVADGNGGVEQKCLTVNVCDVDEGGDTIKKCMVIEAEDMHLSGMTVVNGSTSASGGAYVQNADHNGWSGQMSTTFTGESGECDLTIRAFDQRAYGASYNNERIWVYVNNQLICGPIRLDQNCDEWVDLTLKDVHLNKGDTITISAVGSNCGLAHIDKLTICCDVVDPKTGKIGDTVFLDVDKDGLQDAGEKGIAGATVKLLDASGAVIATTVTDANGNYLFDGLAAGDYKVMFVTKDGLVFTDANQGTNDAVDSDAGANGMTDTITLGAGEENLTVDAGLVDPATAEINGRYFCDENDNSVDDGEPGIAGVTVKLLDAAGNVIATTVTDANGNYSFTGLEAGDYKVQFPTTEAGKVLVDQDAGSDDTIDSDADQGTGVTDTISVGAGDVVNDVDAGVEDPATGALKGRVFCDDNNNNVDDGEPGIGGVTVTLKDTAGNVIGTTTTATDGSYEFTGLKGGDYVVDFPTVVDGKVLVDQDAGSDDTIDSDANSSTGQTGTVTVNPGETVTDVDAGLEDTGTAALKGRVFMDADKDGIDENDMGVGGVTVTLKDGNGNVLGTTTTAADGSYEFTGLKAGDYVVDFPTSVNGKVLTQQNAGSDDTVDSDASTSNGETGVISLNIGEVSEDNDAGIIDPGTASLGDRVWFDTNGNGVQDSGEAGAANVDVTLYDAGGNVVKTTTTNAQGNYLFDNLDAGTYSVGFGTVAGYGYTVANNGADTIDSDAGTDGKTGDYTLAIGQDIVTVDAGLVALNQAPNAVDDAAGTCADVAKTVNVLANDSDSDGGTLTITSVAGQAIAAGQTITTAAGTKVTLNASGELVIDGETAYASLDIGQQAQEVISYTVSDGQGGSDSANLSMTFCGDANSVDSLFSGVVGDLITYQVRNDSEALPIEGGAFDLKIDGTGDARFDGATFLKAYCISYYDPAAAKESFADAPVLTGEIHSGNDTSVFNSTQISIANGKSAAENLDLVNWLLNQNVVGANSNAVDGKFTEWEVQRAIWELTDNKDTDAFSSISADFGDNADVDYLVAQAIANGEGFQAGVGDVVTMIVNPNPDTDTNSQPFIVAMNFEDYDCIC